MGAHSKAAGAGIQVAYQGMNWNPTKRRRKSILDGHPQQAIAGGGRQVVKRHTEVERIRSELVVQVGKRVLAQDSGDPPLENVAGTSGDVTG
jgi:hypothetical protein